MDDKPKYNQQYCKKHKQNYADFLHKCPICRGEWLKEYLDKMGKMDYRDMLKDEERISDGT